MVVFDKEKHTYTNPETGRTYISVSQLLSKYKEPFKKDFFAEKVAKREKVSKEEILKRWDKANKDACDKGQDIHSILEEYIKHDEIKDTKLITELNKVFNRKQYRRIHSEHILYSDEFEVAGMSDCIAEVDELYFDVIDFKTNNKFNFENKYGEYLKQPLNHLQHCHHNDYALQLSLYAYLHSKLTGKKLRKIEILYHSEGTFKSIPVNYLYWDIVVLLKHYGQNTNKQGKKSVAELQS